MKKFFSLLMLVACSVCMNAQVMYMHVWQNGSCTVCPVEYVDSITFSVRTYNAIDLGLPSGTLWADRNVGADAPEAYGDYFAWGETKPKDNYDTSTYKWWNGSEYIMTKYCTDSSYGTVDNKTVLDLEDDAAYVNMGAAWRMPTDAEQYELANNCTWTWTTQNGVNGFKLTGPNGNSIFFPAAPYNMDGFLHPGGNRSCYFTSSLCYNMPKDSDNSVNAAVLIITSGYTQFTNWWRKCGFPVRAVAL
jgi:hypothetical protein